MRLQFPIHLTCQFFMLTQQIYLQFPSLADLKKFRDALPSRKVFILLGQNVLFAAFTEKEIHLAIEQHGAEIINVPVV